MMGIIINVTNPSSISWSDNMQSYANYLISYFKRERVGDIICEWLRAIVHFQFAYS